VTAEMMRLLGIDHVRAVRFEPDETATVIAAQGSSPDIFAVGEHPPTDGGTSLERVLRTGEPARIDDYRAVTGPPGETLRRAGIGSVAAAPIIVEGRTWGGLLAAATADNELPPQAEASMAQFADLVSMAISNAEARADIERLAAEQSALQRVATLVAREATLDEFFPSLAREIRVLLDVDAVVISRCDVPGPAALITVDADEGSLPFDWEQIHVEPGLDSTSCTISVDGNRWGWIAIASRSPKLIPFDATRRLAEFSQQASMAIAGADRRADLIASRARIVQAGDAARRRVERDLHDGAQQQLISIGLQLRALEHVLPGDESVRERLSALSARLDDALGGLRELSHGLHPAVLFDGGLTSAVRTLARRNAIPVDLRMALSRERYDEPVEVAAYYVVSEALANTIKHADASSVTVELREHTGRLEVTVRDDGQGGADPGNGSGLVGLRDRVEAIGGAFRLDSPVAAGTTIEVSLPLG
jgi:signal transduction histidine kinase